MFGHRGVYICKEPACNSLFIDKVSIRLTLVLFTDMRRVDMRSNSKVGEATLIHKKGSKVVGLRCNPVQPDLLLSCGNDHFVSFYFLQFTFLCRMP